MRIYEYLLKISLILANFKPQSNMISRFIIEFLFPEQAFGSLLLLVGKVHFNYIYGIGVLGCLAMYGLLTLMSMAPVPPAVVVSVLGYCILPIVMLSAVSVVFSLQGGGIAIWTSSDNLLDCKNQA